MLNKNHDTQSKFYLATYVVLLCFLLINIKDVFLGLNKGLSILNPFILAIGIAFVLNIPMTLIEDNLLCFLDNKNISFGKHIKRPLSIILTLVLVVGIISTLLFFVIPQLIDSGKTLGTSIPKYLASFEAMLENFLGDTATFELLWNDLMRAWQEILSFASKFFSFAFAHVLDFTINLTSSIVNFVLAIVFAIYMLSSKEILLRHINKVLSAYFPKRFVEKLHYFGTTSNFVFSKFIAGQCLEAVIIGFLCFVGMLVLQLPYALLISVIIGFTSIVPIFGAFIGTIPALFIILIISPIKALIFLIFIIVLQQIEGDFIYPKVVGSSIGLSPIWVMFAMLIGGSSFGFLGLLLGIPTFGVFYKIFVDITNKKIAQK